MDYVKRLNEEVKKGFSKTYLEKLIGLPKNTLAGCLTGSKKMTPANQALTIRFLLEHPELDILSMPKRTRLKKQKPTTSVGVLKEAIQNMGNTPVAVNTVEGDKVNQKKKENIRKNQPDTNNPASLSDILGGRNVNQRTYVNPKIIK